jgi:hypothetical protein
MAEITQDIIDKTSDFIENETGKKIKPLFSFATKIGQKLAEELGADKNIVIMGTMLMDLKLKQAMKENRIEDHVQMSLDGSKDFLKQFNLSEEILEKIYSCIKEHHGMENFSSKESEICANADCYKFLHPKGFLRYLCILNERYEDLEKSYKGIVKKIEEKEKVLSLEICKKELIPYYTEFKKLIEGAIK